MVGWSYKTGFLDYYSKKRNTFDIYGLRLFCQSQSVESSSIQSKQLISIVMGGEGLFDGQAHEEGGGRDDSRDRDEERKARNRAALKKFRDKEKKEKEEKARRMEELRS